MAGNGPINSASTKLGELPLVESIGVVKTARGWVAVWLGTRGNVVEAREVLSEPGTRATAVQKAQLEFFTRVVLGSVKGAKS